MHKHWCNTPCRNTVADPGGGPRGPWHPPGPVKIGHKKDGRRRQPHRFHVSRPPLTRPLDPLLEHQSNRNITYNCVQLFLRKKPSLLHCKFMLYNIFSHKPPLETSIKTHLRNPRKSQIRLMFLQGVTSC